MSNALIEWAAAQAINNSSAQAVFQALAHNAHEDADKLAACTIKYLMRMTKCCKNTVIRALKYLRHSDRQLIIDSNYRRGDTRRVIVYTIPNLPSRGDIPDLTIEQQLDGLKNAFPDKSAYYKEKGHKEDWVWRKAHVALQEACLTNMEYAEMVAYLLEKKARGENIYAYPCRFVKERQWEARYVPPYRQKVPTVSHPSHVLFPPVETRPRS
jgi:hypothetical protein